jgi:hypothetical protein
MGEWENGCVGLVEMLVGRVVLWDLSLDYRTYNTPRN